MALFLQITRTIFKEEMIAYYEDTRSNTFFSQLINLKKKGSVMEHIEKFQRLNIKVTDIPDEHLIDVFIRTLNDNIEHEVRLWEPISFEQLQEVMCKAHVLTTPDFTKTFIVECDASGNRLVLS